MSHTPGTWTLMCDEARGRPRCMVVCSRGNQIADINPYRETWERDARLIAEAPEMYRVIHRLATVEWMSESELSTWVKKCKEMLKEIEGV